MDPSEWIGLLQQKPTPPTWQFEGPFSDLTFISAGSSGKDWNQEQGHRILTIPKSAKM